ncbi:hypothetical protein LTS18_003907, partial [Coniosporium uncinatum]
LTDEDPVWLDQELILKVKKFHAAAATAGEEGVAAKRDEPLRIKVSFSKAGSMSVEFDTVPRVPMSLLFPSSLRTPEELEAEMTPEPSKEFKLSAATGGTLSVGASDYTTNRDGSPTFCFYLDSEATENSAYTSLKTTRREMYDAARARVLPKGASPYHEVLMYDREGRMTEGSLTTVYFWRNGRWVTPPVEIGAGGQRGTTRRWALGKGLCVEEVVEKESVVGGEIVWVSNGVRGFGYGKVQERKG